MTRRWLLTLAPLGLLAGCGNDQSASDDRNAAGEVLEGSISDAMLPLDRLQSQAPLAEPEAARKAAGSVEGADGTVPQADADRQTPAPGPSVSAGSRADDPIGAITGGD